MAVGAGDIEDDLNAAENVDSLQGQQLRIAGADADSIEFTQFCAHLRFTIRLSGLFMFAGGESFDEYRQKNVRNPGSAGIRTPVFVPQHALPKPGEDTDIIKFEQVFRLPGRPTDRTFPSCWTVVSAVFVSGYGGGSATDFHRLPY